MQYNYSDYGGCNNGCGDNATGMSTYYEVTREYNDDERIPIGYPFPNTSIVLLDDNRKTPASGQSGEICIRGAGLSLGYYGDRAGLLEKYQSEKGETKRKGGA